MNLQVSQSVLLSLLVLVVVVLLAARNYCVCETQNAVIPGSDRRQAESSAFVPCQVSAHCSSSNAFDGNAISSAFW